MKGSYAGQRMYCVVQRKDVFPNRTRWKTVFEKPSAHTCRDEYERLCKERPDKEFRIMQRYEMTTEHELFDGRYKT